MTEIRKRNGIAPRALEFTILTAARTGEVLGARWDEIDLEAALWTIPPERMKSGRSHRVPVSPEALTVVEALHAVSEFVFPGRRISSPLHHSAMLHVLKTMGLTDATVHGFRSTFRDWCSETTSYPRDVAEMALAHAIGDQTEASYRRGDLLDKRRALMTDWGRYCVRAGR